MTPEQAQKWIVLATFVTVGSTSAAILKGTKTIQEKEKKEKEKVHIHRLVVGGFAAMMICSVIAEADAKIGVGLAALVSIGAFSVYGLPTIEEYYGESNKTKQAERKQATTSTQNPKAVRA